MVPEQPLEAILVDRPPGRRRFWWGLGCGAACCLLACGGGLGGAVAWFSGSLRIGPSHRLLATHWQSPEEKRAGLHAAFDGAPREPADPDLAQLRRLLDRVAATGGEDPQAFAQLVDFDGLRTRVLSYPRVPPFNWLDRRELMKYLRRDIDGPGNVDTFQLVAVERVASDQVLVYAYARNAFVQADPFRFWIWRVDGDWRLVDWERCETGWSEAEQFARAQIEADDHRLDPYERAWNLLGLADERWDAGQGDAARGHLQQAGRLALPPDLADLFHYTLAFRWYEIEAWDECVAACQRAANPDAMPGIYSLQARGLQAQGKIAAALEAVQRYDRALGFQPEMVRTKAELLQALGRSEEALACRRRLACFAPDHTDDVYAWCRALPESQRGQVVQLIRSREQPLEAAAELARTALYAGDDATRELLQAFVEETAPGSPEAFALQGCVLDYQGEYDAAAAAYRQAAERVDDPQRRAAYWMEFLGSMVEAGDPLAGYRAMPDGRDAFQTLIAGIEDDEALLDARDLPRLIQVHRQHFPDDAWLHFASGWLAASQNDLEQADRDFAAAEVAGEPLVAEPAAAQRRSVLHRQGRLRDAYEAYAEDANVFQELAAACRYQPDPEGLRMLLGLQQERHPHDPWIRFYTAVLRELEDQPQAALDALAAIPAGDMSGMAYQVRWLRLQLQIELGRWRAAYATSEQPREAFRSLADVLLEREDWDSLGQLYQLHQARDPDDPELLRQSVEWAEQQGQDAEVVRLLTPWPAPLEAADYGSDRIRRRLTASLLRLGRTDEARVRAEAFADGNADPVPLLMVLLHERDWPELASRLDDPPIQSAMRYAAGYGIEDYVQAYRADPAARSLRERLPLPLPPTAAELRLVLFRGEPLASFADRLQGLAAAAGGATLRPLPVRQAESLAAVEVCRAGNTLLIASGSGAYGDLEDAWRWSTTGRDLREVVEGSPAWIEIQVLRSPTQESRQEGERLARAWAAEFCDAATAAVAIWEDGPFASVIRATEETAGRLRDARPVGQVFPQATPLYLEAGAAADAMDQRDWPPARRQALRAFCHAAASDAADAPGLVQILARYGCGCEPLWLRVRSCEHAGYGSFTLQGELQADSRLWPYLKRGEPVQFYAAEIVDWKSPPAAAR